MNRFIVLFFIFSHLSSCYYIDNVDTTNEISKEKLYQKIAQNIQYLNNSIIINTIENYPLYYALSTEKNFTPSISCIMQKTIKYDHIVENGLIPENMNRYEITDLSASRIYYLHLYYKKITETSIYCYIL